jgi:serine/threonine-protein kinase RsbW
MGLKTEEAADPKPNIFLREVVLSDEAPAKAQHPTPPEEITQPINETVALSIDSKLELVEMVELVARRVIAKMGFDEDDTTWIELAIREAVVNGILHGNQYSADKRIDVQFHIEPEAMAIYVRDHGEGFDPTCLADPLAAENLLNPSNRGIFLIRTLMDEVQYSGHPEGGCVVRMKKHKRSSKQQILVG